MTFTTQFLPFAIETNSLVLPETVYSSETWLSIGFGPGIADPASCNTIWRQTTFVSCGISQWLANTLGRNINDDGNVTNFVNLFSSAITVGTQGGVISFNGRQGAVVLTSTDVTNALGYTPVQSINGRSGAVVLNLTDVTNALGFTPANKGGDTMIGLLSGPTPLAPADYATKGYVDSAIGTNNTFGGLGNGITGNSGEYTFPLGDGGFLKVGLYEPAGGINNQTWLYNFATPFPTLCSTVNATFIGPTGTLDNSWGITIYTNTSSALNTVMSNNSFLLGISGPWNYGSYSAPNPTGIIWTAIGY